MSADARSPDGSTPGDTEVRRYRLTQAILEAALQQPPAERLAFVAESCRGDDAMRVRVEALLSEYEQLESVEGSRDELVNSVVGSYRLTRQLGVGQGGMAEVYLGERQVEYAQQVAVKVIRRDIMRPIELERFRQERQILAGLSHAHIARLLDGGTLPDSRPYFVMEYVDGQTITEYCSMRGLAVRDRLRLFERVCEAVQYAHQHLVVHRDLKPANILVDAAGQPKLLDFGIAKLLTPDGGAAVEMTQATHDAVRGTLRFAPRTDHYASPEQLRGEGAGTSSDVYSLGIVLYELLTGVRPFDGIKPDTRALQDVVIAPPSTRVVHAATGASRLSARALRGDLDAIVMKALAWQADSRYASVAALGDDIGRHLAGDIVSPRRQEAWYVLTRRAAQHRSLVGAALIAIVGLGLGSAGLYRAWQSDRKARLVSEQLERQGYDALTHLIEVSTATPASPSTAALKSASPQLLAYLAQRDQTGDEQRDPQAQVRSLVLTGRLQEVASDFEGAKRSYERASQAVEEWSQQRPGEAAVGEWRASTQDALVSLEQHRSEGSAPTSPAAPARLSPPAPAENTFGNLEQQAQSRLDALTSGATGAVAADPSDRPRARALQDGSPDLALSNRSVGTFIPVGGGQFVMGCSGELCPADAQPAHTVSLAPFSMMAREVTVAEYRQFALAHPAATLPPQPSWSAPSYPVVGVGWTEAQEFCSAAGGRLPTEAEWELAAGTGCPGCSYPWGSGWRTGLANAGGHQSAPAIVGSFPANRAGFQDLIGNVAEWTEDWYAPNYYSVSPAQDPRGPRSGTLRTVRGGSYRTPAGAASVWARSTRRQYPSLDDIGFRCVRSSQ